MGLAEHMCVLPFRIGTSSRRDGCTTPILEMEIREDSEFLKRGLPPAQPKSSNTRGDSSIKDFLKRGVSPLVPYSRGDGSDRRRASSKASRNFVKRGLPPGPPKNPNSRGESSKGSNDFLKRGLPPAPPERSNSRGESSFEDPKDFLKRGLPPAPPKRSNSRGEGSKDSKVGKKKKRKSSKTSPSARLTFYKLLALLKEAYITTMKSFAGKPGGLGGVAMGGKIDLPDATPSRSEMKPRDFVRSWENTRPDYIKSPFADFTQSPVQRARPSAIGLLKVH